MTTLPVAADIYLARRRIVPFRVAYGTDVDLATENGLEFELVVWIKPEAVKRPVR